MIGCFCYAWQGHLKNMKTQLRKATRQRTHHDTSLLDHNFFRVVHLSGESNPNQINSFFQLIEFNNFGG